MGSGMVFISSGTITTWRMEPTPVLSLRMPASFRKLKWRIRRSRLLMGLK
jgi:hypothetical protein